MSYEFIEHKSQQLTYYVSEYLRAHLPYSELHIFIWDTLEEWEQVKNQAPQNFSSKEKVFWHLMHQLEYWPDDALKNDKELRQEIQDCICFLKGINVVEPKCVGIRP